MEKKERYDGLARCLCAAYKAYTGGIGIDYMLKTYVKKQKTLPRFWFDVAEIIDRGITGDFDSLSEQECIDLLNEHNKPYDLKPLTSMTDKDIEKLVEKLPEGCDVCGNPPPEIVVWLLKKLRDLPMPKESLQ